ncbi:MAG: hypothetical protein DCF25_20930 [Leptolyngbya foveolarum]|uniref:Uncharacterized protein n=1 Tax=Leptolyngbya foveolarum TaxID=47253 RepID=A0A2W4TTC4_9CYAN|nr:MAG: hypothetical protein DCF25_20930 [Leptolyngbya foveolarum]
MSRESCLSHPPKQAMAIIRQDYYQLTGRDACAAALLNLFEYWANAAISTDPSIERPWVGARPIREFEQMLLGIATDKQIRKRLVLLEASGFIQTQPPARRGAAKMYRVLVPELQQAVSALASDPDVPLGSNNQAVVGQMTEEVKMPRLNNRLDSGQMTQVSSVKQPVLRRSNDRALKKISPEFRKEDLKEKDLKEAESCLFDLSEKAKPEREKMSTSVQVGTVCYSQPPETIDLAELWTANTEKASAQLRAIAPGHKRLAMVAHGFGYWWVGPGLNDFDEHLIRACRNRKRKFQQSDSDSDAKTFINNMIRNGDWGNFALRCEEAQALRERATALPVAPAVEPSATGRSPFERSEKERQASALGLARFKVGRGEIERAKAIAQQFGLRLADIGLSKTPISCAA